MIGIVMQNTAPGQGWSDPKGGFLATKIEVCLSYGSACLILYETDIIKNLCGRSHDEPWRAGKTLLERLPQKAEREGALCHSAQLKKHLLTCFSEIFVNKTVSEKYLPEFKLTSQPETTWKMVMLELK